MLTRLARAMTVGNPDAVLPLVTRRSPALTTAVDTAATRLGASSLSSRARAMQRKEQSR